MSEEDVDGGGEKRERECADHGNGGAAEKGSPDAMPHIDGEAV